MFCHLNAFPRTLRGGCTIVQTVCLWRRGRDLALSRLSVAGARRTAILVYRRTIPGLLNGVVQLCSRGERAHRCQTVFMSDGKTHVLLTGASGLVGGILREQWGDRYRLRLADIQTIEGGRSRSKLPLNPSHEEFVLLDTSDLGQFTSACEGIDVVVHLAADPSPSADFYGSLLDRNVKSTYNAFAAAAVAGCRRVVIASSVNAVLGYGGVGREGQASGSAWDAPVWPVNVYGATKCWGEALARVFSTSYSGPSAGEPADGPLSCICVRLGSPRWDPEGAGIPLPYGEPQWGLSARDCGQLFGRCVDVEDVRFAIVAGVSRHALSWMDVEHTCSVLGYSPEDSTGTAAPAKL